MKLNLQYFNTEIITNAIVCTYSSITIKHIILLIDSRVSQDCRSWVDSGGMGNHGNVPAIATNSLDLNWKGTFAHPLFTNGRIIFGIAHPLYKSFLRHWFHSCIGHGFTNMFLNLEKSWKYMLTHFIIDKRQPEEIKGNTYFNKKN